MRLMNTSTGEIILFEIPEEIPPYAILSHTWGANEQSLQDVENASRPGLLDRVFDKFRSHRRPRSVLPKLGAKIRDCCHFAKANLFDWVWIDTCCIDKTNLAELSESINSMFRWYRNAELCIAFLDNVHDNLQSSRSFEGIQETFKQSRWFKRGWTLQELIAPSDVLFVSSDWKPIGSRISLAEYISAVTGIDTDLLIGNRQHSEYSVAQRISWSANRDTKKSEDRAYCLLGILDVNMTVNYGEGAQSAFRRLQHKIIKHHPDQSLFAWVDPSAGYQGLLARSPAAFETSGATISIQLSQIETAVQAFWDTIQEEPTKYVRRHTLTTCYVFISFTIDIDRSTTTSNLQSGIHHSLSQLPVEVLKHAFPLYAAPTTLRTSPTQTPSLFWHARQVINTLP